MPGTKFGRLTEAVQRFLDQKSEEARQNLQESYEAVPEHLRWFMWEDFRMDPDLDVKSAMEALEKKGF